MKSTDTQTNYVVQEFQAPVGISFDQEKIELMRRTIARGASEDELALFVEQCMRTGLDPFARQIYSVRRKQWNGQSRTYEEAQVIQVSIDGFRLIADRTHKYAGQVGPWWCGPEGDWVEVWLSEEPPAAARMGVMRHDFQQPLYAVAIYKSYVQTNAYGEPVSRWKTDPAGMLAKCAEALALRRAFPHELSGLYTTEEMSSLDSAHNPTQTSGKPGGQRPFTPDELQVNFARAVTMIENRGMVLGPDDAVIVREVAGNLLESPQQLERYLQFVTGVATFEDMSEAELIALNRLLKPSLVNGQWLPSQEAVLEAADVIAGLDVQSLSDDDTDGDTTGEEV